MRSSSSAPERKEIGPSPSSKLYWALILLLPAGWWIGVGGDKIRRTILATAAIGVFISGLLAGFFSRTAQALDDHSKESLSVLPDTRYGNNPSFSLPSNIYWLMLFVLSVFWWIIAGGSDQPKSILLAAVSLAAFMIGTMAGFLFTSFGDELATFGKIRDWVIAGITGATVAELAEQGGVVRTILLKFVPTQRPGEFGLVISMAVVYFSLGFFFMFLQRELLLNVLLAKSRAERGRLDGTVQAGLAIQKILQKLPPSLLTGIDSVDAVLEPKEAEELRTLLECDDVTLFLNQAEQALKDGHSLDWDTVSKVAYIYYYKVYCASETEKKDFLQYANQWIQRALILNPMHVDLLIKYADLEMIGEDYATAVAMLEQLAARDDSPGYVKQWLGYALLQIPERLTDSIKYSQEFLHQFPDTSASMFNIALAYAKLYCREIRVAKVASKLDSENRLKALAHLEEALEKDPDYREHVQKNYSSKGGSFECMDLDPDYRKLVGLDATAAKP
ncbi:MAG TPA: tetratricopeptide repeat protein [Candidatus Angelobacter sp.]|jgi:tetratricopeptide (TPR) repeat protein|nr:tetratricopeptide repeat protein [Candidatus Angelobacter sp.]